MNKLFLNIYNWLTWHYCNLCGIPDTNLICNNCLNQLDKLPINRCNKCQKPINKHNTQCFNCKSESIYYDRLYCKFSYLAPLSKVLHDFKYNNQKKYNKLLGYLLYQNINLANEYDIIIPVPLNKSKYQQRRFNQSEKLLDYFTKQHQLPPVSAAIVVRTKDTQAQALMTLDKRKHNVAMAFSLKQDVTGLNILIVDDVVTSGSTINELAKLLKQNGAKKIDACCLMR